MDTKTTRLRIMKKRTGVQREDEKGEGVSIFLPRNYSGSEVGQSTYIFIKLEHGTSVEQEHNGTRSKKRDNAFIDLMARCGHSRLFSRVARGQ